MTDRTESSTAATDTLLSHPRYRSVFDAWCDQPLGCEDPRLRVLATITVDDALQAISPRFLWTHEPVSVGELATAAVDALCSAAELVLAEQLMRDLAAFVATRAYGGAKSTTPPVDVEFSVGEVHYAVAITAKALRTRSLEHRRLTDALAALTASAAFQAQGRRIQPVLGVCWGNGRTRDRGPYLETSGQSLWYLLSGHKDFYLAIGEALSSRLNQMSDDYWRKKAATVNRIASEFFTRLCKPTGSIDWTKLVAFNSANM